MAAISEEIVMEESLRKIFVGGLHKGTTDETFRVYFGQFGSIQDSVVIKNTETQESRGFGFVTYATMDEADNCLKRKPHNVDKKDLDAKRAVPRDMQSNGMDQKSKKIFLGGISHDASEEDVKNAFNTCCLNVSCTEVKLMRDRESQKLKGFGFVTFEDEDMADKVKIGKDFWICGKKAEAKPAQPQGGEGGQQGGRGGGRGGASRGAPRGGARGGGGGGGYQGNQQQQYSNGNSWDQQQGTASYGGGSGYDQSYNQQSSYGGYEQQAYQQAPAYGSQYSAAPASYGSSGTGYWDQSQGGYGQPQQAAAYGSTGGYGSGGGGGGYQSRGGGRGARGGAQTRYQPY